MDEDDDRRPPIHWGDFGALFLAGGFSLFSLYLVGDLLLGGHPMAVLFRTPPAQTQARPQVPNEQEQMAAPFQTQPGEVVLSTKTMRPASPAQKPQNPKPQTPHP